LSLQNSLRLLSHERLIEAWELRITSKVSREAMINPSLLSLIFFQYPHILVVLNLVRGLTCSWRVFIREFYLVNSCLSRVEETIIPWPCTIKGKVLDWHNAEPSQNSRGLSGLIINELWELISFMLLPAQRGEVLLGMQCEVSRSTYFRNLRRRRPSLGRSHDILFSVFPSSVISLKTCPNSSLFEVDLEILEWMLSAFITLSHHSSRIHPPDFVLFRIS